VYDSRALMICSFAAARYATIGKIWNEIQH
jgi:hypothetical protein